MPRQTKEDLLTQIDMLNADIANLQAENVRIRKVSSDAAKEKQELFMAMKDRIGLLEDLVEAFQDENFCKYKLDENSRKLEALMEEDKDEAIGKLLSALGASGAVHISKDGNGQMQMEHFAPGK